MSVEYPDWLSDPEIDDSAVAGGVVAGKSFRSQSTCPHPLGSLKREQWLWGWGRAWACPLPKRSGRRMPTLKKILKYHQLDPEPACVRCSIDGLVDRAHIIDRSADGLDNCANLAPLCKWCHLVQPIFHPGDEAEALAWFGLPLPAGLRPFEGPVEARPEPLWMARLVVDEMCR